ncbi:MAG TPA: hypothetical protein VNQ76_09240 [Planctomicrobium sp.]|nr:hypothetical protein [Planctomicrobium sp.]
MPFLSYSRRMIFMGLMTVTAACFPSANIHAQTPVDPDAYRMRVMIASSDGSNIGIVMHVPGYVSNGSPAWSADGKQLAIDAWKAPPEGSGNKAQIIVTSLDGTKTVVLGDGAMPSFSPDGTQVTYCRYSGGIWTQRVDEEGAAPKRFSPTGWCSRWSPDGTCISFTEYDSSGRPNFCLQSIEDGSRHYLFEEGDENPFRQIYWNYSWSPDGQFIAASVVTREGTPEIITISTKGASSGLTRHAFKSHDHRVTVTPDGRLMFSMPHEKKTQIFTLDPRQPNAEPERFPLAPDRAVHGGILSPDGTMIAFLMNRPLPDFAER